jgi:putative dimethyl sulfoxide reductase chaperone
LINSGAAAAAAAERSVVYWLLADLFLTCPDGGLVHRASRGLQGAAYSDAPLAIQLRSLETALPRDDEAISNLAVEYTRLFGAVSRDYGPPPPYESLHRPDSTPNDGSPVSVFYAKAGFAAVEPSVPPDHLGVELRFMALLCHSEGEFWRSSNVDDAFARRALEREFLGDHVGAWAPEYLASIERETSAPLYRALCAATREWLVADVSGPSG